METYFLLTGVLAGILAGLFGIGGGLVIVPALFFILPKFGIPSELVMHIALATSLATIVVTSISSAYSHYRHNAILWPVFLALAPGLVLGSLLAGQVASFLRGEYLTVLFVAFEFLVALQMLRSIKLSSARQLPGKLQVTSSGVGIGFISGLVGIGGGTLTVPYLSWYQVSIKKAVATSAACGFPIAIGGMIGFIFAGWGVDGRPENSSGYVYWPAFIYISISSVLCSPIGAFMAHRIKSYLLKYFFAVMLILVGLQMLSQII